MTEARALEIANEHLDRWFGADPAESSKLLPQYVAEGILAAIYEEGCKTGMVKDANSPEFIRRCGPKGASDA